MRKAHLLSSLLGSLPITSPPPPTPTYTFSYLVAYKHCGVDKTKAISCRQLYGSTFVSYR